jgi:hypothetical protein
MLAKLEFETIIPERIGSLSLLELFHRLLKTVTFSVNHLVKQKNRLRKWKGKSRQFKRIRGTISCRRADSST